MSTGRVVCVLGRELLVEADGGNLLRATPAGRMKIRGTREMPVAGDLVQLRSTSRGTAIVGIEPRTNVFTRTGYRGAPIPVVANLELLVVVISAAAPAPSLSMLDRFLVVGERGHLRCTVCLNKIDLVPSPPPELAVYPGIGYPLVVTSALTGQGMEDLHAALRGRVTAMVGPSGAGKSSLVNAILGSHAQQVREISAKIQRGRHTTTSSRMLPLEGGGHLVDTPGLGWLGTPPSSAAELAELFPEFRRLRERCRFGDCRHVQEPGCGVKAAVEAGSVAPHRYASFFTLAGEASSDNRG
ncbi:MAG: ribosome small subunit-dependent GTPase A [Candidatus Eisenbacteria bacterium]|nr:ribosome small subunit-dependent GTPase A [Candidatus Eisenbacteria bacterium]